MGIEATEQTFQMIEGLVKCGDYYHVEQLLDRMGPIADTYGPAFLMGIVALTKRCKEYLRNRDNFIRYVEASLVERIGAERFERLLKEIW